MYHLIVSVRIDQQGDSMTSSSRHPSDTVPQGFIAIGKINRAIYSDFGQRREHGSLFKDPLNNSSFDESSRAYFARISRSTDTMDQR